MSLTSVLASAALICAASVAVGQGVWRLGGFDGWAWLAAPVGLATLVAAAGPATALPGAGAAGAVVLLGLTVVALAIAARSVARKELAQTALVAALGLLVSCLPFAAAGRVGILAVTDNPDFYGHLMLADALRTGNPPSVSTRAGMRITRPGRTRWPHRSQAGLGIPVDAAFTGVLARSWS